MLHVQPKVNHSGCLAGNHRDRTELFVASRPGDVHRVAVASDGLNLTGQVVSSWSLPSMNIPISLELLQSILFIVVTDGAFSVEVDRATSVPESQES